MTSLPSLGVPSRPFPLLRTLSLGAGVQSTTLALMAERGEIPKPNAAIFADTQWEPKATYQHLDWLETQLSFPVRRVSAGNLRESILAKRNPTGGRYVSIPTYTVKPTGEEGMGRRQCTAEFKLVPISREIRRLLGKPSPAYIPPEAVEVVIGISLDEVWRIKPARQKYMRNIYPLIDLRMTRRDCVGWLIRHGYPVPPKSSCIGCPYHGNATWAEMRQAAPKEWEDAVSVDRSLREGSNRGMVAAEFLHAARVPLSEADLGDETADLFSNECAGVCAT